ncbi:MAG: hypothetical protein WC499_01790 [Patescibacteria group bacterium]
MREFEQFGENNFFPDQEKINKKENPTDKNPVGQVFNSSPRPHVEIEKKNEQQELINNLNEILEEPREVLKKLNNLAEKKQQKSVPELLWNLYAFISKDIQSNQPDRIKDANNLIGLLETLDFQNQEQILKENELSTLSAQRKELGLNVFTKENFQTKILNKAIEYGLILLVSSKIFDQTKPLQPLNPTTEFYYPHLEKDPQNHKSIQQIDQYKFNGDLNSETAEKIFYELAKYARLIEPLEKIFHLKEKYREKLNPLKN